MKKYILILVLCCVACTKETPTDGTKSLTNDTITRDTALFPNKAYPIRIVEVQYDISSNVDAIYFKDMADTTVSTVDWKIASQSSGRVVPVVVNNGFRLLRANAGDFQVCYAGSATTISLNRAKDTLDLIAPDGKIAQRVVWANIAQYQSVLPFWKNNSKLRIRSVMPNPVGADDGRELISIHNVSADTVYLRNWTLISAKGNQIKYLAERQPYIEPYKTGYFAFSGAAWLNNMGDNLSLVSPDGVIVQTLLWGDVTMPEGYFIYAAP